MKNKDKQIFDYERIRNEVNGAIVQEVTLRKPQQEPVSAKKFSWKSFALAATYTLLIVAVTICSTVGVYEAYAETRENIYIYYPIDPDNPDAAPETPPQYGMVYAGKQCWISQFDRIIASGGFVNTTILGKDILSSYLICEADKDVFSHYVRHSQEVLGKSTQCTVTFGVLNGEDYIGILTEQYAGIYDCPDCNTHYIFKCNLGYSLDSLVKAFEEMTGQSLPDEVLMSPEDSHFGGYMRGGIYMRLNTFGYIDHSEQYNEYEAKDKYQKETREVTCYELDKSWDSEIGWTYDWKPVGTEKRTVFFDRSEEFYIVLDNRVYTLTRQSILGGGIRYWQSFDPILYG